jgi:hypothetical protein
MNLEVFSVEGKRMIQQDVMSAGNTLSVRLDMSEYAAGMYLLKLTQSDKIFTQRLVVTK